MRIRPAVLRLKKNILRPFKSVARSYTLRCDLSHPPLGCPPLFAEENSSESSPTPVPASTSPTTATQPSSTEIPPNPKNPVPTNEGDGTEYQVDPEGNPMSLTKALEMAGAGDTISLADGLYREPIVTMSGVSMSSLLQHCLGCTMWMKSETGWCCFVHVVEHEHANGTAKFQ